MAEPSARHWGARRSMPPVTPAGALRRQAFAGGGRLKHVRRDAQAPRRECQRAPCACAAFRRVGHGERVIETTLEKVPFGLDGVHTAPQRAPAVAWLKLDGSGRRKITACRPPVGTGFSSIIAKTRRGNATNHVGSRQAWHVDGGPMTLGEIRMRDDRRRCRARGLIHVVDILLTALLYRRRNDAEYRIV